MKPEIIKIIDYLKSYNGPKLKFMEVCGSHTAAIAKSGIRELLADNIEMVSGPGCPVCVTPSAYIDRLIEIALGDNTCVATFGDMIRVPGSRESLRQAKGRGAHVEMVYSPMDTLKLAKENPQTLYVFAAVGFETTTPVYALMLDNIIKNNITNVKLLTALKTMPSAVDWLCDNRADISGFIAPGHVCVITGSNAFVPAAMKFNIPFAVAGFEPEQILTAIYGLVKMCESDNRGVVKNYYPSVVTVKGNVKAQAMVGTFFEKCNASWRGMGIIEESGMCIKERYAQYDMGSDGLNVDKVLNDRCCCGQILTGKMKSEMCPLFGKECTPLNPQGACMVSMEGSCYQNYVK